MPSPPANLPPYKDLFIYYLKGRVASDPVLDGPTYIGNWQEEDDAFLFFKQPADIHIHDLLQRQSHLRLKDYFQMTYDEWQGGALAPIQVGCLHIVPPWHDAASDATENNDILLDPGVVFGTGTHPTTSDCLAAVQMAFERQPVGRVLDLGTGTGLLALAAVRLGAECCLAVDLNRLAADTARRNVQLNRMTDRILVVQGDAKNFMDLSCDLMVSNIHYDIMLQLVGAKGFRAQKQFILSGLLRSQAREIEYQLKQQNVKIIHRWSREGVWHTFYGRNA